MIATAEAIVAPDARTNSCAARPGATNAPRPRFTLDGDGGLERHLERTCARVLAGIRGLVPEPKLEAVLLGGGYGRGEGGVLRGPTGDRPYNDLEFYVAIAGNRHVNERRYRQRLEVLGEILTHYAGVEVELKITSFAELAGQPVTMYSYDLVAGHRLLASRTVLPAFARHANSENIPPAEATRLLMNRCSGLLLARAKLAGEPFTVSAGDFVRRNIAKAQLACGDAVLTAFGRYHWSCRERHLRLQHLAENESWPWLDAVLAHHSVGVEFKLHPTAGGIDHAAAEALHREVTGLALQCWLCLEARRLSRPFPTARSYAEDAGNQCPDSPLIRNVLLNLRADGFRPHTEPRPWRHPRQRIFRSLALLLWEPAVLTDPQLRHVLSVQLQTTKTTMDEWIAAYRGLWCRVR